MKNIFNVSRQFAVCFILLISITNSMLNAQNAELVLGESLEDENKPKFIDFIGADESGVYFFKHGKKDIFYVEKYDAVTLKLAYRCILPNPFKDKTILTKYYNEKTYYTMLKGGIVDIVYVAQEDKNYNFYHSRVSIKGECNGADLIFSEKYSKELSKKLATTRISANRQFIMISNGEEIKDAYLLTCLKITNTPNEFKLSKFYETQIQDPDVVNTVGYYNLFNDGRIGAFYNNGKKDFVFTTNQTKKIFNKAIKDIVPNIELSYDIKNYITTKGNLRPKMFRPDVILSELDSNLILTTFDKQKRTYAFVNILYNKYTNEYTKGKIDYLNPPLKERFKGGIKDFDDYTAERITFNQTINTDKYTYKILSENYVETKQISLKAQGFLIVLIYDKNNNLVSQSIIPMKIRHFNTNDFEDEKAIHLSENFNVNYGTIKLNNDVYFLSMEDKSNKTFDPLKGIINDFNLAKDPEGSYLACYKLEGNGSFKKIELNYDKDFEVFNIINNENRLSNYQYVFIKSKGDRFIGKVIIE